MPKTQKQKDNIYKAYVNQYSKKAERYGANMSPMMSQRAFEMAYNEYYGESKQNVVRRIVADTVKTTMNEARGFTRAWAEEMKRLKSADYSTLTDTEKQMLSFKNKKFTLTAMRTASGDAIEIMAWLNTLQEWGQAVGS